MAGSHPPRRRRARRPRRRGGGGRPRAPPGAPRRPGACASLEAPRIDGEGRASFDILWCPHQDHYAAFDCRVQRCFVQGMLEAAREHAARFGFEVRFDTTIPSGAATCHFTLWKPGPEEKGAGEAHTRRLEEKALARAKKGG